jgi:hypothetical protein
MEKNSTEGFVSEEISTKRTNYITRDILKLFLKYSILRNVHILKWNKINKIQVW